MLISPVQHLQEQGESNLREVSKQFPEDVDTNLAYSCCCGNSQVKS